MPLSPSALRELELAHPTCVGAGERSLLEAEELGVDQRRRQGHAVERHERLLTTRRALMHRARRALLAGAALAGDQRRDVRDGDLGDVALEL
jgi:hypothetical protein